MLVVKAIIGAKLLFSIFDVSTVHYMDQGPAPVLPGLAMKPSGFLLRHRINRKANVVVTTLFIHWPAIMWQAS